MSDPTVEGHLAAIHELSEAFAGTLLSLEPAAWDAPTNCDPWRVRDLVAHVVTGAESFAISVRRGLAGSTEPAFGPDVRQRRQDELAAAGPAPLVQALRAATGEFGALYDGLEDDQLDAICFHRRGKRTVRWYAAHRLAEVAFHSWDLAASLNTGGPEPSLAEDVAAMLLPTLIESNAPATYQAGLTAERGGGERILLAVAGDASIRWLISIDPDRLRITRGGGLADLDLTGSPAALALLVYGRRDVAHLAASGDLHVQGDPAVADRFGLIFPKP